MEALLTGLLYLLLYLVVLGIVCYAIEYVVGLMGLPPQIIMLVRIAFGIIALIIIVNFLLGLTHGGSFIRLPH